MSLTTLRKPKNSRAKRFLKGREPKLIEIVKNSLFLKGSTCNETMNKVLRDLHTLRKPDSKLFNRKNDKRPFEDETSVEFLCQKNDAALFAFASHSKKRPQNLVLGRMFDDHVLDMVEFGVSNYKSIEDSANTARIFAGGKASFVFQGDAWYTVPDLIKVRNLMLDFFVGKMTDTVNLVAVDHAFCVSAVTNKDGTHDIFFRSYKIVLKKSSSTLPRVEMEEIGPCMDLSMRRTRFAPDDMMKQALKTPARLKPTVVKNVSRDEFGSKVGKIHMQKQDLSQMQVRKVKALKTKRKRADDSGGDGGDGDGDGDEDMGEESS